MSLPKEAELLGTNSAELIVKGSGGHTIVKCTAEGQQKLIAFFETPSAQGSPVPIYLALENIRGNYDAAVLNAYLNLPDGARPGDHRNLQAGSAGLYGLTRASAPDNENGGQGLTSILDISRVVSELFAARSISPDAIPVSIIPNHPLPDSVEIVIGRISIFTTSLK